MENRDINQIILSFLQGEATTNQLEVMRQWISESDEHKRIFETTKHYWENSRLHIQPNNLDQAYEKLKLKRKETNETVTLSLQKSKKMSWGWLKYAAVFFFIAIVVGVLNYLINPGIKESTTTLSSLITKENPKGQKLTTYLPDGSKVILNSESKISYNSNFKHGPRHIELVGEAFFEVKKDALKPFVVKAQNVHTTALGTSFNINTKNPDQVEVVLVTGKVALEYEKMTSFQLLPGEASKIRKDGSYTVEQFDYLDKVGWKDGVLAFKDNTLPEILMKLESWYGVEFSLNGSLEEDLHYTGKYKNESLEEVLQGISFVHHFEFKIDGDTVEIMKSINL